MNKRLDELVVKYDLKGLIEFSNKEPNKNKEQWRTKIMQEGFISLYEVAFYDWHCGKLPDGLDWIGDILKAAEQFQGSPLRKMRAEVLLEKCLEEKNKDISQAKTFAHQAIEELSFAIPEQSSLSLRAHLYHQLSQLDTNQAFYYWQLAIEDYKEIGSLSLDFLYHEWVQPINGMAEAQQKACADFIQRINLELELDPNKIWKLLDEAIDLLKNNLMPKLEIQFFLWMQTDIVLQHNYRHPTLRSAGVLLHEMGKKQQRTDYLAKAVECFECIIIKAFNPTIEMYLMANTLEDWAQLDEQQGQDGVHHLLKAWDMYRTNEAILRTDYWALLYYAEFLERLYFNNKIATGPTTQEILALLHDSKMGVYSTNQEWIPIRLALSDNDTDTAIHHLRRLLLWFDALMIEQIKKIRDSLTDKTPQNLVDFLDQTLHFLDDLKTNYCRTDSGFKVTDLNKFNRLETATAWQQRMTELRNK